MQALGTDRISYHRPVDCRRIQQRYILSLLGSLALALGYVQRFCLSLAIVEMAEQQTGSFDTGTGCSAAESPVHGNVTTASQKVVILFCQYISNRKFARIVIRKRTPEEPSSPNQNFIITVICCCVITLD